MVTPQPISFGALLKRYRRAAELTQDQLAALAGYSTAYVSMLERNARPPTKDIAVRLAEALVLGATERANLLAATRRLPLARPYSLADPASTPAPFMPSAARPPLVGRQHEQSVIADQLAGQLPPLLLLVGEPGIGKSRLLHEAAALARTQGWTVLEGGCHRRSGQEPYAPLLGALQSRLRLQTPAQMRLDLQGCTWLVRLLPELAEVLVTPAPRWSLPLEQENRLMFAAVARYLANIGGPMGTLLVLDDLQWACADALDLLADLVRGAAEFRLRLIGAYRNTDTRPGDVLSTLRAELMGMQAATSLELGHLNAEEAAELLEHLLAGREEGTEAAMMGRVLERAGGNPFFLVSYARGLRTGALGSTAEVPQNVVEATRQRVAALPASAQELLGVAALIGRRSPRKLLFAVAAHLGHKARQAVIGIEAACQARLLVEDGDHAYIFAHDLIREVVSRDISAARRATLHGWIAETLERERDQATPVPDTSLSQLAYQFSRADMPERAVIYLEQAGDEAHAMCAYSEAQRYFQDLMSHFDTLNRPLDAARARAKLGAVLRSAARYDEAISVLQQAVEAYSRAGDPHGAGRALAQLGWVQAVRGTTEEGIAQVRAFLDRPKAAALQPTALAMVFLALVQLYKVGGHYAEMLAAAESAASQAAAAHDAGLRAKAEQDRGTALLMLGRNDEGAQALEAALPGLVALDDPVALARALNTLSVVRESQGDFAQARQNLARANAYAERSGDPTLIAFMVNRRATNAFARGDWQDARADYERALATLQQIGSSWANPYPFMCMGRLDLAMGRTDTATRYLDEAAALADRLGDVQAQHSVEHIRAEADMLADDARAVIGRLAPLYARTEQESDAAILLPPLIWAYDFVGETQRADALLERALQQGATAHGRLEMMNVRRVQAQVAARRGDWDAAETACLESLALCQQIGLPYSEVRALFVLGQIYAAEGATERAREPLHLALDICARLGERLYAAHIGDSLARLLAGT